MDGSVKLSEQGRYSGVLLYYIILRKGARIL